VLGRAHENQIQANQFLRCIVLVVLRILAALILLVLLLGAIGIIVPLKFLRLSRRGAAVLTLIAFASWPRVESRQAAGNSGGRTTGVKPALKPPRGRI
jgi:hypothetical protein